MNKYRLTILLLFMLLISCMKENNLVGVANPFIDYDSLKQASDSLGFSLNYPQEFNDYEVLYRVGMQELLELIFKDNEQEIYRIRKEKTNEDISGDYNNYTDIKNITVNNITYTLKGYDSYYDLALWQDDDYSYVFYCKQLSEEEILSYLSEIY